MMDETANILRERMKDRHVNMHTVCWSGKKTGKEAEEKQNQWNLIRNNEEDQDGDFRSIYEYDAFCTDWQLICIGQVFCTKITDTVLKRSNPL